MITVTIYPTKGLLRRRQYRWTARARNNRVIATSGSEKYFNHADLVKTLRLLFGAESVQYRTLDTSGRDGTLR